MDSPKFKNKDGSLTAYAMACGYVQTERVGDTHMRLSFNGYSYDVQLVHEVYETVSVRNARGGKTRSGWAQYDTLSEARAAWRTFKAQLLTGDVLHDKILQPEA